MKEKENEKRERESEGRKKNIEEKVLNGDFVDNVLVVLICDQFVWYFFCLVVFGVDIDKEMEI